MLVGDQEQTSTKQPRGYVCWQMVKSGNGLMNHPILKVATNVGILHTHKTRRSSINVGQNSLKREYANTIRGNVVRERRSYTKGTEARVSSNTITTPTPSVSRRSGANLHQAAQTLPPLANGLVGEGLNEPPNSHE